MEAEEIKDFEALINIFFPLAEEMLRKFGEFHPFAGAISNAGEVVSVGQYSDTHSSSENELEVLKSNLKTGRDLYKAGTVFYDARTKAENGEVIDAIAVFVEHKEGKTAYEFFYPYELNGSEPVTIHESFGNALEKEIF
jgi:hypothetical protein